MQVTNINGTSANTCKCGSWLAHWERFSGLSVPKYCPETSCLAKPEVGAHVQKVGINDWFIIPLCDTHNKAKGPINVSDFVQFVSANVSQTCGS